ncbi:MAG TPA: beta-ketoacyl-ACP synthase II [Anaerolineae bacterium]|nr:beta-ketoacyl-ACP synthase II [Anaerolineae bacterium]HQH37285.1 beta-ketoacyl-ACP synthase II [Anaerolineae bacterium]
MPERTRVVVTGMGAITPVGLSVRETWENALAGKSGIAPIQRFDASPYPVRIAGEVKGFDPERYFPRKEARRMARCSQFALVAAQEALADAGLPTPVPDPERTGTVIGVGMGGLDYALEHAQKLWRQGLRGINPFALVASLPNMPSYHVSLLSGAQGPIATPVAACATGSQAIGEGANLIRQGWADIVLAGGAEGLIIDVSVVGFAIMGALSRRNDEPERASRPFDKDRDGFVVSEGAGVLVLEHLEHAQARGAHIYGEVLGYASSSDAYHIAQPDPEARGVRRAMTWALQDAGVAPEDIDYINAHGTSTPLNDTLETLALKKVFGAHAYKLAISSNKSIFGHTMGAAGAIETILTFKMFEEGLILPTLNLDNPDPACDLDYVPWKPRPMKAHIALKNAFGFGGQNACLVLSRWNEAT